jgi:DMSO/TMAO reductase YedYZ molybdopterin-dependent catalytic subunit
MATERGRKSWEKLTPEQREAVNAVREQLARPEVVAEHARIAEQIDEDARRADEPLSKAKMEGSSVLKIEGAVESPLNLSFNDLAAFPESAQLRDVSRFQPSRKGDGVTLDAILDRVKPKSEANYLTLHADRDDFHVSIPLEAVRAEAVVVYRVGEESLPLEQGGPIRFLIKDPSACHTSELDDCANVKYLSRIELTIRKGRDTRPTDEAAHAALHQAQEEPAEGGDDHIEIHFHAQDRRISLACGRQAFSRIRDFIFEEALVSEIVGPPSSDTWEIEILSVPALLAQREKTNRDWHYSLVPGLACAAGLFVCGVGLRTIALWVFQRLH